ncbi:MAG: xylulokinase [Kiritimatiellae bacterium]|nr:xylulokinase [Kiritimatiellia bacterium]
MKLLLGIDYGTGGCKVTVIDEAGSFIGEASTEFATYHEHPGWSEQEPQDWWNALAESLKKLAAKGVDLKSIAGCALDGSTHNAVLLDAEYRPVRRTIMWTDQRATAECEALKAGWGEKIFSTCYQMPAPTWTLPQMMWLKANEPEVLEKTEHVLFVKDYVRYLLTGEPATDRIEAQGTLMWAMPGATGTSGAWDAELVALSGLKMSAMPKILEPTDVAGRVTAEAAAFTGLPEGLPVVCGSSDSAVEDYGAGAVEPGDLILKLATAGNVNSMTAAAHPHPKTLTYSHIVPGMWYSVSATNAAALCMRWFRDSFYVKSACGLEMVKSAVAQPLNLNGGEAGRFKAAAGGDLTHFNLYSLIDEEASSSPVGANGVFFHPYLQGERCPYWDSNLRASFTGVSISSTRGDFARALMEGVAFSLRDCYRTLEEMKLPVKRIFLIGGGARSRLWSEIVANVFNRPVSVPQPGDASFGSCLLAGTGIGIFPDVKAAVAKCLHIDRTVEPDPATAVKYDHLFTCYRRIHDALAPTYVQRKEGK